MPWKRDLSKLKAQLGEDPPAPARLPRKSAPPAPVPASMAEEDALFLAAMGMRPSAVSAGVSPSPSGEESEVDFASAMASLEGLKPLAPKLPEVPAPLPPPAPELAAEVKEEGLQVEEAPTPAAGPGLSIQPLRIQLAAGMAIDVDGHLDLRGHSRQDAIERLRDRLEDAKYLRWRTLHLTLGPAQELHDALLGQLQSGGLPLVQRYAQAPVPMGGPQAWILYLTA